MSVLYWLSVIPIFTVRVRAGAHRQQRACVRAKLGAKSSSTEATSHTRVEDTLTSTCPSLNPCSCDASRTTTEKLGIKSS